MHFGCVVLVLYSSILVICWVVACGLLVVVKVVMVVLGPAGPGCRGGRCVVALPHFGDLRWHNWPRAEH